MNELALFSGAGGGILGGRLLGWRTVAAVELSEYRRAVLERRQIDGCLPNFPIWDDIRTFDGLPWRGRIDVVSGGFPCPAYSPATRGRSTADDLWPEMRRVVAETAPRHVFAENVTRAAIQQAAEDLCDMGYEVRCISLGAKDLGADHARTRYWLRAYAHGDGELFGAVDAKASGLSRIRPRVWDAYTDESRVANGLANRLERIRATGDGQIPCVAATAWRLLGEAA